MTEHTAPIHPPDQPVPLDSVQQTSGRSNWPTVIGVICMVFGAMGALTYACNGVGTLLAGPFMQWMADSMPPQQASQMEAQLDAQMAGIEAYLIPTILSYTAATALAVWQLLIGIGLLRRRRWTRTNTLAWSGFKVAQLVIAAFVGYLSMVAQMDAIQEMIENDPSITQGGGPPANLFSIIGTFGGVGIFLYHAVLMAWPIFLVVWLNRVKIKDEVATW